MPSGSRDQNTSTNGLLRALNIGSTTLAATSAKYFCCSTLASVVPGVVASPVLPLSPRVGAASGSPAAVSASRIACDSGMPAGVPVASSMMMVVLARAFGVVEHHCRADLADGGSAEILVAGRKQNGVLVDEISGEMLVDVTQHRIAFDERRHAVVGVRRPESRYRSCC